MVFYVYIVLENLLLFISIVSTKEILSEYRLRVQKTSYVFWQAQLKLIITVRLNRMKHKEYTH